MARRIARENALMKHKTPVYDADRLFFTSDTHFGHRAMLNWRPFKDVGEMNDAIIRNWNDTVPAGATVFHLGDVSFGNRVEAMSIIGQLNGNIHLIQGNHDKGIKGSVKALFASIQDYLEIDVVEAVSVKQRICMMHFPLRSWNRHHFGSWHLHGHCHGNLEPLGKSMDVGLESCNLRPISYDWVKTIMGDKDIHTCDHHEVKA